MGALTFDELLESRANLFADTERICSLLLQVELFLDEGGELLSEVNKTFVFEEESCLFLVAEVGEAIQAKWGAEILSDEVHVSLSP